MAKPELPTTEKMLMMAMESNPDILVAKAKLREVEAELNRTRLQVIRQIMTLGEVVRYQRVRVDALRKSGNVPIEELRKAATELSAAEAELQYTLGQSPLNEANGK
jgi:multidrug resistance efflux pump